METQTQIAIVIAIQMLTPTLIQILTLTQAQPPTRRRALGADKFFKNFLPFLEGEDNRLM